MTLDACAAIVERADPDRWRAVLAAPVAARKTLLPLYAFNVEVARAPWLTQEPLIAEMRLQWWADVLEEIAGDGPVRRHEVATPLADMLSVQAAKDLLPLVEARRRDVHREAFGGAADVRDYLDATAGRLAWVAALCLGASGDVRPTIEALANAGGLTRLLIATPELERRGWRLWRALSAEELSPIVAQIRDDMNGARVRQKKIRGAARAALLPDWRAAALLALADREPERIRDGTMTLSPFRDRALLLRASLTGRI